MSAAAGAASTTTTETQTTTSAHASQTGGAAGGQSATDAGGKAGGTSSTQTTETPKPPAEFLGGLKEAKQGEQGAQGDKSKDEKSSAAGELEIKLPDGVKVDETLLTGFKSVAKELGLNSESGSKLAAWYATQQESTRKAGEEKWKQQGAEWAKELKGDASFGGPNLDKNTQAANKALIRFGGESTLNEIRALGLEYWPPLVKMMANIGTAIAEDNSSGGNGTAPAAPSRDQELDTLYPSMNRDGTPKSKEH